MKDIKQTYKINASVDKVWEALVDSSIVSKWTGSKAKMNDKEGDEFSLWDGDIYGKNVTVKKPKLLVQEWYGGDWDKPSMVKIGLISEGPTTKVALTHKDVPDAEASDISDGWNRYYFGEIKKLLE